MKQNKLYYVDGGVINVPVEIIAGYTRYEQERAFEFIAESDEARARHLFMEDHYDFEDESEIAVYLVDTCELETGIIHDLSTIPDDLMMRGWEVAEQVM